MSQKQTREQFLLPSDCAACVQVPWVAEVWYLGGVLVAVPVAMRYFAGPGAGYRGTGARVGVQIGMLGLAVVFSGTGS